MNGSGDIAGETGAAGAELPPALAAPPIKIVYYTDPLCCWSWALEPHWRRLRDQFGGGLDCRYRMAAMIADWSSYNDPLNAVSRPAQMGPIWRQAQHLSGVPVDDRIWVLDPPASSYPACLAVKAAELQSAEAADLYLGRLREAVMANRRNIARREVLLEVAEEAAAAAPNGWTRSASATIWMGRRRATRCARTSRRRATAGSGAFRR